MQSASRGDGDELECLVYKQRRMLGVFLPATSMRSHIAGHILLKDVKAFACGGCRAPPPGPGQSGCQPKLQSRRGTKREDQPDPRVVCQQLLPCFYSALGSKAY
jgi:hypothetical protein